MSEAFDPPPPVRRASAPQLTFNIEFEQPRRAVVHLVGDVDHFNSWVISSLIEGTVLAGCTMVELDAHDVAFTDSSLLSAIEACQSTLAISECRVCIRNPSRCVIRMLELLNATRLLHTCDDDDVSPERVAG